ncbi:RsfA family transcriptional regulator [Peribacillus tepidiphilus]|uniref:RsfA family transcriptional regulator n=1 Tax=Peribacillus tepidiphilus TaxID=2652445 RepID=UPI001290AAE7|nr:RsfA family transcriptional regulator [Peribacillus tepidiphilus]
MSITRQDAWSQDEDLLLAEVVLRHIREGSTQLVAFEEVGKKLSRTAAACGFRWNSFVRKQYKTGIELAKKHRKENKKRVEISNVKQSELKVEMIPIPKENNDYPFQTDISMKEVVAYLQSIESKNNELIQTIKKLEAENMSLSEENSKLKFQYETITNQLSHVEEDYRALLDIMERARKLVILEDDKKSEKVKFQMDRNGNLERLKK